MARKGQSKNRMRYMTQRHLYKLKTHVPKPKIHVLQKHIARKKGMIFPVISYGGGRRKNEIERQLKRNP